MPRKSTSTMEDAFLQSVLDHPDDDTPRLVFADWLEEQGNPRGTFIRIQCERAKLTRHDPKWRELLAQESALLRVFESDWSKPMLRCVDRIEYRRGFIEHIHVTEDRFLKRANRIFQLAPVRSVRLERVSRLDDVAECPWLSRVTDLDLSYESVGGRRLQSLVLSEHCRSLRGLRVKHCKLRLIDVQVLAQAPALRTLHALDIAANDLFDEGIGVLKDSANLANLRDLNVSQTLVNVHGVVALCSRPVFRLTRLALNAGLLRNDGLAALANCPEMADLRRLEVESNEIGNLGLESLVRSQYLTRLEHLDLSRNQISSRGIQVLTESPLLAGLSYLNLKHNEIDRPTLQTLPQRLQTPRMRELLF